LEFGIVEEKSKAEPDRTQDSLYLEGWLVSGGIRIINANKRVRKGEEGRILP
jgi:hypothetical protein